MANSSKATRIWLVATLLCVVASLLMLPFFPQAEAVTGATVTNYSTETLGTGTPGNRSDARGTITTVVLDATQQDPYWKGYVGNVTGALTLDNADGDTLYDWSMSGVTLSGEVYATRNQSASFTGIQCAQQSTISNEEAFNNMSTGAVDAINQTFNWTIHEEFWVGTQRIGNSSCRSTFTYVNDSVQSNLSETSPFQEVLIEDDGANLIYTTIIEDDAPGYILGKSYDFQMIVGESDRKLTPTTYYFFVEIGT